MNIETIKIGKLNPSKYNPRKKLQPGDPEYQRLKKSILEFDYIDPIVWNKLTGNVVGGHQRLKILIEMGRSELDVSVVELTDQREKALNLTLNKTTGEWDDQKLAELLYTLIKEDTDIELTGFSEAEVKEILAGEETKELDQKANAVPEAPKVPTSKYGDIYQLGDHRIMCGDSTNKADVAQLMDGTKANMIFTDPPYNVDYGGGAKKPNPRWVHRKILNDKQTPAEWQIFCGALYENMKEWNDGNIYMWGPSGPEGMRMRIWLAETGCHWASTIIWKKDQLVLSPAKYQRIYEPCFFGWYPKDGETTLTTEIELWNVKRPKLSPLHPTQKPVELGERAMYNSSQKHDVVADWFLGSGSTLISCEKTERICYGMDHQYLST